MRGRPVSGDHTGRHVVIASELNVLEADSSTGGCEVDTAYAGPKLEEVDGKYKITEEFIQGMIEWFKAGKTLPKRYVWEIVLGAHEHFAKGESLVDVDIPDGVTIDVIGDVHGK